MLSKPSSSGGRASKTWRFPERRELPADLVTSAGGSQILAELLLRRGIDNGDAAKSFLDPQNYKVTSPMEFSEMPKAIVRITEAIGRGEKICVYGDYDVDGVTATSLMYSTLKSLGANVDFYIPNRLSEGYGLNIKAVSILASKQRVKLLITCDCGISNFAEINLAKSLGVETIIVDHHSLPELLPPAVAILHPKQLDEEHPLYHLPGVGVAYKLAEALLQDNKREDEICSLLDFVTLGMIADMVPLVRENRYLVQIGLPKLLNSSRAGIKALLDNTARMDGSDIVGFGLAPRINAVGRLADASLAVKLMTVEDEAEAKDLAGKLELENARRQELCEQIFFEADKKAKQALANSQDLALALYSPDWHHGVVGIVASRLVEKYHCPVFVAELDLAEGKLKGSARGVAGVDLYAILKENEELMLRWGGHQMAAGFSAESANADVLCRALVESCNKVLAGKNMLPVLDIDLEVSPEIVDLSLTKLLKRLGPFGMWNKKPVLSMLSLKVLSTRVLGKEGKHHRLILQSSESGKQFECVYWRSVEVPAEGEQIDLAFTPEINVFNNAERLQLVLSDWRVHGQPADELPSIQEQLIDFSPPDPKSLSAGAAASDSGLAKGQDKRAGKSSVAKDAASAKENAVAAVADQPVLHLETSYDGQTASSNLIRNFAPIDQAPDLALPEELGTSKKLEAAQNKDSSASSNLEQNFAPQDTTQEGSARQQAVSASADIETPSPAAGVNAVQSVTIKDLRVHADPKSLVAAAARKVAGQLNIFAENCKLEGHELQDRCGLVPKPHLFVWQFPPSLQTFKSIIQKTQAKQIYLCGQSQSPDYDAASFLKRLFAMARFAVNQRDGEAPAEKLCAGLATTKMALALGLTVLKKAELIDWYAEDSIIYLDITESPEPSWERTAEYKQLEQSLKEITEFRNWCAEASLDEIQSELIPNSIRLFSTSEKEEPRASQEGVVDVGKQRAYSNDRKN